MNKKVLSIAAILLLLFGASDAKQVIRLPSAEAGNLINTVSEPSTGGWQDRLRKVEILVRETICTIGTLPEFPVLFSDANMSSEIIDGDHVNRAQDDMGDLLLYDNGDSDNKNGYEITGTNPDSIDTDRLGLEKVQWTLDNDPLNSIIQVWAGGITINCDDQNKDRSLVLYYNVSGHAGKAQPAADAVGGSQSVWDSNYEVVLHMDESSGSTVYDSTSNLNHFTDSGSPTYGAPCKVGNCISFDRALDQRLELTQSVTGQPFTFSVWLYLNNGDNDQTIIAQTHTTFANQQFRMFLSAPDDYSMFIHDGAWDFAGQTASIATWQYWSGHRSSSTTIEASINGGTESIQTRGLNINPDVNTTTVGALNNAGNYGNHTDGEIDEVRISSVDRSNDWARAEYNSMNAPETHIVFQVPTNP